MEKAVKIKVACLKRTGKREEAAGLKSRLCFLEG